MPTSLVSTGIQFPDDTIQTTAGAGGNYVMRTYNSPATWTKPAGLKAVKVTVVGGGGGGGGARGTSIPNPNPYTPSTLSPRSAGQGGGGGAAIEYIPAESIPGPVAVTSGSGGTAGPAPSSLGSTSSGGTGGTSSFGAFLSATGGAGATGSPAQGTPGGQGSGSGGDLNVPGGRAVIAGRSGDVNTSIFSASGAGAQPGPGTGVAGGNYGGGATGALSVGTFSAPGSIPQAGAVGGSGVVIVEEFY